MPRCRNGSRTEGPWEPAGGRGGWGPGSHGRGCCWAGGALCLPRLGTRSLLLLGGSHGAAGRGLPRREPPCLRRAGWGGDQGAVGWWLVARACPAVVAIPGPLLCTPSLLSSPPASLRDRGLSALHAACHPDTARVRVEEGVVLFLCGPRLECMRQGHGIVQKEN